MDLIKIIQDLREERKKLEQIITSLEELESSSTSFAAPEPRRGRRFMDSEARMEVSRRMKKYWESRRKKTESAD